METNKKIFVIAQVDSVIDVITNSSSELFICKTNKSLETVDELLLEMVTDYNQQVKDNLVEYGSEVNAAQVFAPLYSIGDNLESFVDNYNYLSDSFSKQLKKAIVGNLDEVNWEVMNNGEFVKEREFEKYRLDESHPEAINFIKTKVYQRDKKVEFLAANSQPEVLKRLKDFIVIESLNENSIPYDIWETINNTFNGNNWHLG